MIWKLQQAPRPGQRNFCRICRDFDFSGGYTATSLNRALKAGELIESEVDDDGSGTPCAIR